MNLFLSIILALSLVITCGCSLGDPEIPTFFKDEWVTLENDEAFDYLTKYELCMAKTYRNNDICNRYKQPIDMRLGGCALHNGGVGHVNGLCPAVDHVYRHHSTQPWPNGSNFLSIVQTMLEHGSNTLVLLGDSLTAQSFADVRCNVIRYGMPNTYLAEHALVTLAKPSEPTNMTFQVVFLSFTNGVALTEQIGQLLSPHPKKPFLTVKGSVLFLFNMGLHYSDVKVLWTEYRRAFAYFVDKVKKQGHVVFFRETTAQHFPTQDGAYGHSNLHRATFVVKDESAHKIDTLAQRMMNPSAALRPAGPSWWRYMGFAATHNKAHELVLPEFQKCTPLSGWDAFNKQNWRNTLAASVLKEVDRAGLVSYIPFFQATAARDELHLEAGDCTHYCHNPLLWLVLWDRVHEQLVKVFEERSGA